MPRKGENIYKRKDGRWEGRYPKGRERNRTRFGYVFGHTYQETKEKLLSARAAWQSRAKSAQREQETLGTISMMWLSDASRFLKESTVAKYRDYLDYYILPNFGAMPMGDISDKNIEELLRRLRSSGGRENHGLAAQTLSEVLRILKNLKKYALHRGAAVRFSIDDSPVKRRHVPLRIFSGEEIGRLKSCLASQRTPCCAGILLCMLTGIRLGELCALRWDDISLAERHIHIHATMQRIRNCSDTGPKTKIVTTSPKSDSADRIIPLPDELCRHLAPFYRKGAYLLTGKPTKFMEPRVMQRRFKVVLEECGIEPVNFHTLRHTFATRCVEAGFDPKCLSVILGHADVTITFNRYVHPTMETKRRNMAKLQGFAS